MSSLPRRELVPTATLGSPDETAVGATVAVQRRLSPAWMLGMGLRYRDRGPHLDALGFSLRQRQVWVFAMLTALFESS